MTNKSWIDEKMQRLASMEPIPADAMKRLHGEFRLQHTYHSNAIEGNTLSLQETKLVLEEGVILEEKFPEQRETINGAMAYDIMVSFAGEKKPIDHITIQKIHEVVMLGLIEEAGRYRTKNVRIIGATKTPPDWTKVVRLMDGLIEDIAQNKRHPVETAAYLHHRFVGIHPFVDGNGRVARLLTNLYLISRGYPPIIVRVEDRMEYYKALDAGDPAPFTDFIARAVDKSLNQYLLMAVRT